MDYTNDRSNYSQLKFPFSLKVDQTEAVNVWMDNNCRGTILYSTGTGKTEISFECARKLVETYKKRDGLKGLCYLNDKSIA